jgi:hypothetical protein
MVTIEGDMVVVASGISEFSPCLSVKFLLIEMSLPESSVEKTTIGTP